LPFRASAFLLVASSVLSFSQTAPTTSLSGSVLDSTGSAVVNAALELRNTGTHFTRRSSSDPQGRFLFNLIPPGVYELTVSAAGFTTVTQKGITLHVDVPGAVHLNLSLARSPHPLPVTPEPPTP